MEKNKKKNANLVPFSQEEQWELSKFYIITTSEYFSEIHNKPAFKTLRPPSVENISI